MRVPVLASVVALACLVLVPVGGAEASSETLTVCPEVCEYADIEEAAMDAPTGGTVLVHNGSYGSVSLPQIAVEETVAEHVSIVANRSGEQPEIDGLGLPYAVRMEASNVTLDGFLIRPGSDAGIQLFDGADNASFRNNTIYGNIEFEYSEGRLGPVVNNSFLYSRDEPSLRVPSGVEFHVFRDNLVSKGRPNSGVVIEEPSDLVVENNTFELSEAYALRLDADEANVEPVLVHNNTFQDNLAGMGVFGSSDAGLSAITLRFNSFEENVVGIEGPKTSLAPLDARFNWWGSPAGPTLENPVLGEVNPFPWCLDPDCSRAPGLFPKPVWSS